MKGVTIFKPGSNLPFIPLHRIFLVFSTILVLSAVATFGVRGLNYGIDFQGGVLLEIRTPQPANIKEMRKTLGGLGLGEVALQEFGAANDVLIRVQRQEGGDEAQKVAADKVRQALGAGIEYRRVEFVGPKVSEELLWDGIGAVAAAMIAILIYVWFRFELRFSVASIVALVHRCAREGCAAHDAFQT